MPNHVHLVLTPEDGEGLALALSRALRRLRQRPGAADRPSVSGPIRLGGAGRRASDEHERAMWRSIPCGRGSFSGPKTGRIRALSARSCRARRRARPRSAADRPCAAFRRLARKRSRRRRLRPLETERADRSAARFGGLCGGDREASRASARAGQARPQAANPGRRGSIRIKTGVSPYCCCTQLMSVPPWPSLLKVAASPVRLPATLKVSRWLLASVTVSVEPL